MKRRRAESVAPAARPLVQLTREALLERFATALATPDAPTAAHCIHELWCRNETPFAIEALLDRLWRAAGESVPEWLPMRYVAWLPLAYEVCARFAPQRRGRTNVYLVLLDFEDRRGAERYGVYVGQSAHPPAERFDQHKAGIRASGDVLKRGLEVLAGPTLHLQRMSRADAVRIESELAVALAAAGLTVRGGH